MINKKNMVFKHIVLIKGTQYSLLGIRSGKKYYITIN
jgi:hypothetical protein